MNHVERRLRGRVAELTMRSISHCPRPTTSWGLLILLVNSCASPSLALPVVEAGKKPVRCALS